MTAQEILLDCLKYYKIDILKEEGNLVTVIKGYGIEVETNGMYKLISGGMVVAPFSDLDDLCRFITNNG